jgi:hypothetical protein
VILGEFGVHLLQIEKSFVHFTIEVSFRIFIFNYFVFAFWELKSHVCFGFNVFFSLMFR